MYIIINQLQIRKGNNATPEEVIELIPAFEKKPFSLRYISRLHKIHTVSLTGFIISLEALNLLDAVDVLLMIH